MYKFTSSPAYSLGNKPKSYKVPDNPGPGAYDQSAASVGIGRKAPGAYIGHAPRDNFKASEIPGPGAYDKPATIFSKVKGGLMGGKKELRLAADVPGPGAYDYLQSSGKEKRGGFSFGKGENQRFIPGKDSNPGPGAYDFSERGSQLNKSAGNVLSRAARNYLNPSNTPGPGSYEQDLAILKDRRAPAVSKAPRDTFKAREVPGPGGYELKSEFDSPAKKGFSLDRAPRDRSHPDSVPGPGNYDVESAYNKFSIHRGSRKSSSPSRHPQVASRQPERLGQPWAGSLRREHAAD